MMKHGFSYTWMCFLFICLLSCSDKKAGHSNHSEKGFSTSIDSLNHFIDLEIYVPVNVMWQCRSLSDYPDSRVTVPGPTDYVLEAFIQFDQQTADKLKRDHSDSTKWISRTQSYMFEWLPKDLVIKEKIDSSQVYDAASFAQAPFLQGTYVFLNQSTILLSVHTQ